MARLPSVCYESLEDTPSGGPASSVSKSSACRKITCTPCGHLFHKKCLDDWLKTPLSSQKCPSCRASLPKKRGTIQVIPDQPPSVASIGSVVKSSPAWGKGTTSSKSNYNQTSIGKVTGQFFGRVCPIQCNCRKCQKVRKTQQRPSGYKRRLPQVDISGGVAPQAEQGPCQYLQCQYIQTSHTHLQADIKKLQETCDTRDDELQVLPARKMSLLDEKAQLLKKEKEQAELIQKLLKRPVCKCQTNPAVVIAKPAMSTPIERPVAFRPFSFPFQQIPAGQQLFQPRGPNLFAVPPIKRPTFNWNWPGWPTLPFQNCFSQATSESARNLGTSRNIQNEDDSDDDEDDF